MYRFKLAETLLHLHRKLYVVKFYDEINFKLSYKWKGPGYEFGNGLNISGQVDWGLSTGFFASLFQRLCCH